LIRSSQVQYFAQIVSNSQGFSMWPVQQSWTDNGITWNTKPNHRTNQIVVSSSMCQVHSWCYVNDGNTSNPLWQWVTNWYNGTWASYGFCLDTAGLNNYVEVPAMEASANAAPPEMTVTYNTPPPPSLQVSPSNGGVSLTATPQMQTTAVTDPDG